MRTLTIAATKGGVGKTTLAAALGVRAAEDGERVAWLDGDPQGSLTYFWERRAEQDNPRLIGEATETLEERHAEAKAAGCTLVIIDTPPGKINERIEPGIVLANLVLIPAKPSVLDLVAIEDAVRIAAEHAKPVLFVLNQTIARSAYTAQATEYLRRYGTVHDGEIGNRQGYAMAMVKGFTLPELEKGDKAATAEIDELWRVVKRRLKVKA